MKFNDVKWYKLLQTCNKGVGCKGYGYCKGAVKVVLLPKQDQCLHTLTPVKAWPPSYQV